MTQWTFEVKWSESFSVLSDSLWPHGLHSPWNSPGQNTGVDSLSLLQGIFPNQGSNPGIPHSKPSIFWHSAFSMIQLSHPYMTTGKTIALSIWTFVGKVMSVLFNMVSWFVIAFLPRSKHLLISWLQSPSTVILEPKKIKCVTVSIASPSLCP